MSKLKKKILYTNFSKVSDLNQTYKENFIIFFISKNKSNHLFTSD